MSIKDIPGKIKSSWKEKAIPLGSTIKSDINIKEDIFIVISIIFIGLAGFGLGKLSALEKGREAVEIKPMFNGTSTISANVPMSATALLASEGAKGMLVASKNGTKYHFPWCAGASQIAEKNKIWFNSYEEAQKAGYTAAANCKDLK